MTSNEYMHRTGNRAKSEMTFRNAYTKEYGIQHYLLVEGESDEKFFENILDCEKCIVKNLKGKEKVIEYIKEKNKYNQKGYLGIVDADFDHITGKIKSIDNLIFTDFHDIEMLILSSKPNMRRIYSEMTNNIKIKHFEDTHKMQFIQAIMEAAYKIGILRLVLCNPYYSAIDMDDLPYIDITDDDFNVNTDELIKRVIRKQYSFYDIQQKYDDEKEKKHDTYQLCCGHDVTNILALCFIAKKRGGLGYGEQDHLSKKLIEEFLRVIYNLKHFKSTKMYKAILDWEEKNSVEILDKKVFS
ncbi:DUF4435 domain-containing protein [Butyrivibrio sp. AE2005]|uniref:DUF4435 domain-containing protein n=1 Tax=Butyrivibrio sp. AE2005 TaxID=1496722 RepID=UPI00047CB166|nr:DUF4435 domain-containing protein [Butyrivibrio sp. AE2005]